MEQIWSMGCNLLDRSFANPCFRLFLSSSQVIYGNLLEMSRIFANEGESPLVFFHVGAIGIGSIYHRQASSSFHPKCWFSSRLVFEGSSHWGQTVKRLSTMRETQVQSLGWEDLLEKEMATHSSSLAWKIPWMEELGRLQFMGRKESYMTERLHSLTHTEVTFILQSELWACHSGHTVYWVATPGSRSVLRNHSFIGTTSKNLTVHERNGKPCRYIPQNPYFASLS